MLDSPFGPKAVDLITTAPDLIKYNCSVDPHHPFFVFLDKDTEELVQLTYNHVYLGIQVAADLVERLVDGNLAHGSVIGIIASTGTITYLTFALGVLHAGYQVFPISSRNPPDAIANILAQTNCNLVFHSKDPAVQSSVEQASQISVSSFGYSLNMLKLPSYDDLYTFEGNVRRLKDPYPQSLDSPAVILHSSGSTDIPTPIHLTHASVMRWARHPLFGEVDLSSDIFACHAVPPHHSMGFFMPFWAITSGLTLAFFDPRQPPTPPSPNRIIDEVRKAKCTILASVPSFIEEWAQDPNAINTLANLRALSFGGAPLSQEIGDLLTHRGANIVQTYGVTEVGCATQFMPGKCYYVYSSISSVYHTVCIVAQSIGMDWAFIRLSPDCEVQFVKQEGSQLYELVFMIGPHCKPNVFNKTMDGNPVYATNDLFELHPTKPNLWKMYGRKDDQITLSTGMKMDPLIIESRLCRDARIEHAVLFGVGRSHPGIIIKPMNEREALVTTASIDRYKNDIWPVVQKINDGVQPHSRVMKEMIIICDESHLFPVSTKGSPRRQQVIALFKNQIEAAYTSLDSTEILAIKPPQAWSYQDILSYVRAIAHHLIRGDFDDDDNLFLYGCSSLQAIMIRNCAIQGLEKNQMHGLRRSFLDIPRNILYDQPTISSFSHYIYNHPHSKSEKFTDFPRTISKMEEMVGTLCADLPFHIGTQDSRLNNVVLITGSTGSLGCHLLAQLLADPDVQRVYALARPDVNGSPLRRRQSAQFLENGLNPGALHSDKLRFVEGDVTVKSLGMAEVDYSEMQKSLTCIIHNAWRTNFNDKLENLRGLTDSIRHIVDLSLSSTLSNPPQILFMSSAGVFRNWVGETPPTECSVLPEMSVGLGYAESKWVAEAVLEKVAQSRNIKTSIYRLDQICGAKNGSWKTSDAIATIIQIGSIVGSLPARNEIISWLPAPTMASLILSTRSLSKQYIHLRNTSTINWSQLFSSISRNLGLPLVSSQEWMAQVVKAVEGGQLHLASVLSLYDYIADMMKLEDSSNSKPLMDISESVEYWPMEVRQCLENFDYGAASVQWVEYWKKKGVILVSANEKNVT